MIRLGHLVQRHHINRNVAIICALARHSEPTTHTYLSTPSIQSTTRIALPRRFESRKCYSHTTEMSYVCSRHYTSLKIGMPVWHWGEIKGLIVGVDRNDIGTLYSMAFSKVWRVRSMTHTQTEAELSGLTEFLWGRKSLLPHIWYCSTRSLTTRASAYACMVVTRLFEGRGWPLLARAVLSFTGPWTRRPEAFRKPCNVESCIHCYRDYRGYVPFEAVPSYNCKSWDLPVEIIEIDREFSSFHKSLYLRRDTTWRDLRHANVQN